MRRTALVLTVAFVFASTTVLLGHAAGQSGDPMPPEQCCPESQSPDATLAGTVSDQDGNPVGGATVSVSRSGPIYYADSSDSGTTSSGEATSSGETKGTYVCCGYPSMSTVTAEDGSYSVAVYSGDLSVYVYRDGYASASVSVHVDPDATASQDVTLHAYPAKTAHLVGKVTDARTGKGLGFASISVRSPWYGLYECSWTDTDRKSASGTPTASDGSGGAGEPTPESGVAIMPPTPYYNPGCALSLHDDGTYEGNVTPGYSIVSVSAWQPCATSRDADGSSSTSCGPEYLTWSRTLTLPANETTRLDVRLPSRPAPDATVSGYLVDAESGKTIPGATISFSNQETYAYGSATTDQDGSYSLRLRSGYHSVWVYAPGHLSWEGVLQVPKGATPYDVELTPGQESGGGCCMYALSGKEASPQAAGGSSADYSSGPMVATNVDRDSGVSAGGSGGSAEQYQDLGGGLGPYDASSRHQSLVDTEPSNQVSPGGKGSPGAGLLLTGLAVGLALVALRRRLA